MAGALRGSAVVAFFSAELFMRAIHSLGFERLGFWGASCPCLESLVGWPDLRGSAEKFVRSVAGRAEAYNRVPSHQCRPPSLASFWSTLERVAAAGPSRSSGGTVGGVCHG